ncbi:MAG: allophanate hydrolase subunit 1 [Pseudomonadota bacterium]
MGEDLHPIFITGDDTLRIDKLQPDQRDGLSSALRGMPDWTEIVPGKESVTVQFDPLVMSPDLAMEKLAAVTSQTSSKSAVTTAELEVPVAYGGHYGPDLESVAAKLNVTPDTLMERYVSITYRVDFIGFTPGFAYIGPNADTGLNIPRLERPRRRVPAGSVGVVGGMTGIYALDGPGGWPIIGRTPITLFDASLEQPATLMPGVVLRFRPISAAEFDELAG